MSLPRSTSLPDDCFFRRIVLLNFSTPGASFSNSSYLNLALLDCLSHELDFLIGLPELDLLLLVLGLRLTTRLDFLLKIKLAF